MISPNDADLRNGTKHPGFRECAALRGEANERRAWRARSREGYVQSLPSHHPRQRVFEVFEGGEPAFARVLHFEISARPIPSDFGPRNEIGWLARYLRMRKQAEKSITRTGVTTPRGRGSAARDRARGSVRVADIGGKSQLGEAPRSSLFGGMRGRGRGLREARVIQGWTVARSPIVEAAPSKTATEKRAMAHSRHGIVQTLESSSANRRKASSVVWNCVFFTERRKKRPWLDGPHRTPLETVGRKSKRARGMSEARSRMDEAGRKPLFENQVIRPKRGARRETPFPSFA